MIGHSIWLSQAKRITFFSVCYLVSLGKMISKVVTYVTRLPSGTTENSLPCRWEIAMSQPSMAESQGSKALWVGRMIYSPVRHSNTSQLWMFVWSCMWKRVDSSECVCVMLACDAAVWQDAVHRLHVLRRKQVLVFPLSVGSYRMMGRPGLWVGIGRCLNWREK